MAKNGISLGQGNRNWIATWNSLILCGSKCDCVHLNSLSCDLMCVHVCLLCTCSYFFEVRVLGFLLLASVLYTCVHVCKYKSIGTYKCGETET